MKRLIGTLSLAAVAVIVFAQAAFAGDCGNYPASPCKTPTVLPTVIHRPHQPGTAFTGANVMRGFVAIGVLVLIGLVTMYVTRRRAASDDSAS